MNNISTLGTPAPKNNTDFRITCHNINGLPNKLHDIKSFNDINKPDIYIIQEPRLLNRNTPKLSGMTTHTITHDSDVNRKIIIYTRNNQDITYKITNNLNTNSPYAQIDITNQHGTTTSILTTYTPPNKTLPTALIETILNTTHETILIGDLNADQHTIT
jgi:exonuclease III